jgi:hypothetical protein
MAVVGSGYGFQARRDTGALRQRRRWPSGARAAVAALFTLGLSLAQVAAAAVVANWGTVATPIASDVTFSFSRSDITSNFSDDYVFTLGGSAGATYNVTFAFDACRNGCGSPVLSYGIDGGSGTGTFLLAAGTHTFSVTGTGMGSGNSVDYWGSVVIGAAAGSVVSPVPEPESVILVGAGLLLVAAAVRRRGTRERGAPGSSRAAARRRHEGAPSTCAALQR